MGEYLVWLDDVMEAISVGDFHVRNAISSKAFKAGPLMGAVIAQQLKEKEKIQ